MTTLAPADAVEMYLDSRHDIMPTTRNEHARRLRKFITYAETADLEEVNQLDGFHIEQYRQSRLSDAGTGRVTDEQNLHTFRVFLRYLERTEFIEPGLADKVLIPNVSSKEKSREVHLSHERASKVIDSLATYQWASVAHVLFHLTYHTGMRRSALYALDVDDWHPEEGTLLVRHREHTPLKLGESGERNLTISDDRLRAAMDDYLANVRPDMEDEWGREPFFASRHGRYAYKSIQNVFYRVTRPCYYSDECPHDREIESCEAASHPGYSKCPSSTSSHPIRRSAIHHHLNSGIPKTICSERMSVSEPTLDQHYDKRSNEEKRVAREQFMNRLD